MPFLKSALSAIRKNNYPGAEFMLKIVVEQYDKKVHLLCPECLDLLEKQVKIKRDKK
jgi:hypothetical protein